jgi:hypothetical protein|tara:strand:- start:3256 stop:3507 length:252 start_codon:yes stop_codon:yes gene_type:complete
MEDNDLVSGLYPQEPKQSFVKATFGLRKDQFTDFMREAINNNDMWREDQNGNLWLNIDILESKEGKLYAKINKFVPKKEEAPF